MTTLSLRASSNDSENSTLDILYTQSIKFQGADTGNDLFTAQVLEVGNGDRRPHASRRELRAAAATSGCHGWVVNNLNSDWRYRKCCNFEGLVTFSIKEQSSVANH